MIFKSIELNKERKVILIGGIILLLAGLLYRFSPGMYSTLSVADEIEMKQSQGGKYLKVAERNHSAEREHENVAKQFKQMEAMLLEGETASLAAVEIQNMINEIVDISSVNISTIRVLKPVDDEKHDYIGVPVQFSIRSNIVQLKEILYKIESSSKLLIITDLESETSQSKEGNEIRSIIVVEGVMRRPNSSS